MNASILGRTKYSICSDVHYKPLHPPGSIDGFPIKEEGRYAISDPVGWWFWDDMKSSINGVDERTGEKLGWWERGDRFISGIPVGIGKGWKWGKAGGKTAWKGIKEVDDFFIGLVCAKEKKKGCKDTNQGESKSKPKRSNKEIELPPAKSYEEARNKALDIIGDLGPGATKVTGRLPSSAGYGKVIGRQSADGKVRWRLDYDPEKGCHINIEDFREGKGNRAKKMYIRFPGNEETYNKLLKHLNK
ncbi:hypothetical protein [Paludifilum halophilum]|uniref:hypothetical protein n=1 Tax=Paludifilum halophilum TaxID=1642702 RepID=UPI001981C76C|nr:hypothetical protein [Paludifilum halophilum]